MLIEDIDVVPCGTGSYQTGAVGDGKDKARQGSVEKLLANYW